MIRRIELVRNDILRVEGYLVAYSPDHFFHQDMQEKLGKLEKELLVSEKYFESLED